MGDQTEVWCGAALITDLYLLTAAHCAKRIFPEERSVQVVLGSNRVVKGSSGVQQRILVDEVIIHESHDPLTLAHDLALLRLATPVDVGSEVRPIRLPNSTVNYTGTLATAAGWGRVSEGGKQSVTLQEVEVPVLSLAECGVLYPHTSITSDVVCAGDPGKDTCQADSGGPLVVQEDAGRWVLLGITSWGRGCGRPDSPGVYVRVSSYLGWVAQQVRLDPGGYLTHLPTPTPTAPPPVSQSCSCGLTNPGERIVGGSTTSPQEYPWQVALVGYYQIEPFCSGALVADAWVLTAAHCAADLHHDDQVLLGEHKWNSAADTPYHDTP
ncbi:trypsin-1-like [Panulirus ornatus]|uniref:trypsin-1-like n=1 Tax=Panulirus ornatus TaxID=150431 RepID=UPI003A86015A